MQEEELALLRWSLISRAVSERAFIDLFKRFRAVGLEPILFKGWSIARFYPPGKFRLYTDIDLAVDPDEFELAKSIASSIVGIGIGVDLHNGFRDRDILSWKALHSRSYTLDLNGATIRVLGDEDNLRLTAAHWLIDGGVYKDRLWDIYYLVSNRRNDFDWERCLESAGPIRKSWVTAAIATARDYLDLDVSELPDSVKQFELPRWYRRVLEKEWELGPYLRVPLWLRVSKPREFIYQLRRRFPPNPIAATTDVEAPIDETPRFVYQAKSLHKKARPFLAGLGRVATRR